MVHEHVWLDVGPGLWLRTNLAYSFTVFLVAEKGVDMGRDQDAGDAGPDLQVGASCGRCAHLSLLVPRQGKGRHTVYTNPLPVNHVCRQHKRRCLPA